MQNVLRVVGAKLVLGALDQVDLVLEEILVDKNLVQVYVWLASVRYDTRKGASGGETLEVEIR